MRMIKGIYDIPSIKHTFFIVSSVNDLLDSTKLCRENKRRTGYFAHILQSKDCKHPKVAQQWKLIVIEQKDFLRVLEHKSPTIKVSPNQSFYSPERMELLSINLLKTPDNLLFSHHTRKVLSCVNEEDIIEVFI